MLLRDFLCTTGNKILITDSVRFANKAIYSLSTRENIAVKNVTVITTEDIAKTVYNAYCAEYEKEALKLITDEEAVVMLDGIISEKDTFIPETSKSYKTSEEVYRMISMFRNSKRKSVCKELEAIDELTTAYDELLVRNGMVDSASLLGKSADILENDPLAKELLGISNKAVVGVLHSKALYVENRIINAVARIFETEAVSFEPSEIAIKNNVVSERCVSVYGNFNEINYIANRIKEDNIPLGEVAVYYTSPEYENQILAICGSLDIPVRFTSVRHAAGSGVMQLALGLIDWELKHKDEERLYNLLANASAKLKRKKEDEEKERLNTLFNPEEDVVTNYLSLINFVSDYTHSGKENNTFIAMLKQKLPVVAGISAELSYNKQLSMLKSIISEITYGETEEYNAVEAVYLTKRTFMDRKYSFICGLSAGQFTRDAIESPVLSDENIECCFDGASGYIALGANGMAEYRKDIDDSIITKDGGEICYLYRRYDSVELRKAAPSIMYIEKRDEFGETSYDYSDKLTILKSADDLKVTEATFKSQYEALCTDIVSKVENKESEEAAKKHSGFVVSPTAIQTLISCPYKFYYNHIRHIPDIQFNTFAGENWLDAAKRGTMFHRIMEIYLEAVDTTAPFSEELFKHAVEISVEEMKNIVTPPSDYICELETADVMKIARMYINETLENYKKDNNKSWKVLGCELEFGPDKPTRVLDVIKKDSESFDIEYRGSIDRLDGYVDKNGCLHLWVLDYKTGKYKNQYDGIFGSKTEEPNHKIQHYVYALAAANYVAQHLDELNAKFSTNISSIDFEKVAYLFPFETKDKEIDMTEVINKDVKVESINPLKLEFTFPDNVVDVLYTVLGNITLGKSDIAFEKMDIMVSNRIVTEESSINPYDKHAKTTCTYCSYSDICKMKL